MLNKVSFVAEDTKTRKYFLPKSVVLQKGRVADIDHLFVDQEQQVFTDEPMSITMENRPGEENALILLDFGVEFSGGARIISELCTGEINPIFRLSFGESANEAMADISVKGATNDHSARDINITLASFGDMEFCQTGYRFLRLELLSPNCSVRIKSILGLFIYRDIEYKGSFECSDQRLNDIYNIAAYTCHLNMQDMLWDGIKRDRLVWIGDMHPEMLTIRTVFGYDKCIEEGMEYAIKKAPLPDYPNHMVTYAMWWIVICYDWYMNTGKLDRIDRNRTYILQLLTQFCSLVDQNGDDALSQYDTGYFLDWPTFCKPEAIPGVRALMAIALKKGSALCDLLDERQLSKLCLSKADALALKISVPSNAKQSLAFMSMAGHLDKNEAAALIAKDSAKGFSTFMSYYMLSALSAAGQTDDALRILAEYYGAMIDAGATTFWEDFSMDWVREGASIERYNEPGEYDIHGDNGAHCYIGFRHSLCHGWSSAPTAYLAETVLGIKVLEPGCQKIAIEPDLGFLSYAKGTYPTPYGNVYVNHTKNPDGTLKTDYTLPEGVELA